MKNLLILLTLIPVLSFAQNTQNKKDNYAVFGVIAGYNQKVNRPLVGAQLGYRYQDVFVSANMDITFSFNVFTPILFPFTVGYNIGSFQPFLGYSYQMIGKETETRFKGTDEAVKSEWKPSFGLSYYFKQFPLSVTVQRQGNINIASIGIYHSF